VTDKGACQSLAPFPTTVTRTSYGFTPPPTLSQKGCGYSPRVLHKTRTNWFSQRLGKKFRACHEFQRETALLRSARTPAHLTCPKSLTVRTLVGTCVRRLSAPQSILTCRNESTIWFRGGFASQLAHFDLANDHERLCLVCP
jgi:hypothetical protein